MGNDMEDKSRLCPFKKLTIRENRSAERAEVRDREMFECCVGVRCMAYRRNGTDGYCLRLEAAPNE